MHNFVAKKKVKKLDLDLLLHTCRIKAVNLETKPIQGMTRVEIQVGPWKGPCSLMRLMLDDFDVILGNEFLVEAKVVLMLHLSEMILDDDYPSFLRPRRIS